MEQAEALGCADQEESKRAEADLENYLLNSSDEEPMEVEACTACGSRTLPEEAGDPAPVMIFGHEHQALPRPERVL